MNIEIHCKYSRLVAIGELTPHPLNPNNHPAEQVRLFAKIIQHQGWRRAIVVSNRSGLIVAGHGALAAAQLLKCESVPVDYQDFRSEADEKAHLLADNELAQLAERNKSLVEDLLKDLASADLDLELSGMLQALKEPARLDRIEYKRPPKMTYVLISIPTVAFGEINEQVEAIAKNKGAQVETVVTDK